VGHGDGLRDRRAEVGQDKASTHQADPAVQGNQLAQSRVGRVADVGQVQHEAATGKTLDQPAQLLAGGVAVALVEAVEVGEADEGLVTLAADLQGRQGDIGVGLSRFRPASAGTSQSAVQCEFLHESPDAPVPG